MINRIILTLTLTVITIISFSQNDFVENKGQLIDFDGIQHQEVLFYKKDKSLDVYFTQKGISYYFKKSNFKYKYDFKNKEDEVKYKEEFYKDSTFFYRFDMIFSNANSNIEVVPEGKQSHYNNYYYSHIPDGLLGVSNFSKVVYKNVYDSIDFEFYFVENKLKYDIILKPNANINDIKLLFDGAENIKLKNNELIINSSIGIIKETLPRSFTENSGKISEKEVKYSLVNNEVTFKLEYDNSHKLVIDPQITWSTYFDATTLVPAHYFKVRGSKFTGTFEISAINLPTLNPGGGAYFQNSKAGSNDFGILQFDTSGVMQWSTYYGGTGNDCGTGTGITSTGDIVIVGYSNSTDIPTQNPLGGAYYDDTYTAGTPATVGCFIMKFNSLGVRSWATHYDFIQFPTIAIDNNDNIYITGRSNYDTPSVQSLAGAYNQSSVALNGGGVNPSRDMFLIKFNSSNQRVWATNIGGEIDEVPLDITTDNSNNVYVIGVGDNSFGASSGFVKYDAGGGAYYDNMLG